MALQTEGASSCRKCGVVPERDERSGEIRERMRWMFALRHALPPAQSLTLAQIAMVDELVRTMRKADAVALDPSLCPF